MGFLALILSMVALICGGVAFWVGWLSWIGLAIAVIAVVFGAVGIRRAREPGHRDVAAVAGLVLGIIAILVCVAAVVIHLLSLA